MKKDKPKSKITTQFLVNHLQDSMLLQRCILDGLDYKLVGEDAARKVVFLCAMGSLVLNSTKTSYNLLVNSESGAGKDYLVDNVLKIFGEIVLKRTRISPAALTYWHNSKFEPGWNWDGKILYLEDCSDNIINCDVFKVFVSSGSYATIVKDQRAIDIKIVGKPVVIITSAETEPNNEMLRRFLVVNLNEGKEQTGEVMFKWAERSIKGEFNDEVNYYHKALSLLKPGKVKIPWAKKALKHFPKDHIHMRTHFTRFLDLVKASTILHQFQREKDTEDYFIAEEKDYTVAREIIIATTTNKLMIPLTKNQKDVIKILKEIGLNIIGEGTGEKEVGWTHSELCSKLPFSRTQVYREITKLVKLGFIKKELYHFEYDKKASCIYSYFENDFQNIPPWKSI